MINELMTKSQIYFICQMCAVNVEIKCSTTTIKIMEQLKSMLKLILYQLINNSNI